MRPRISNVPRGFKAKLSAELLNVGPQTLRYWREHLDPAPLTVHFTAGRLLAYRILKVLIRNRHIPVESLERCPVAHLFECCEHVAMSVLERSYLYVNTERSELVLFEQPPVIADDDFDSHVQSLRAIVVQHRDAWELIGRSTTTLRQQLQVPVLTVVRK